MKSLVVFSALCAVAFGSAIIGETPAVAAARASHLLAHAAAAAGRVGVLGVPGIVPGVVPGVVPALGAGLLAPGLIRALPEGQWNGDNGAVWIGNDNGQWNGDNGALWIGNDNGQWHGEGVLDGSAYAGARGNLGILAAGDSILNNGQWSPAIWGDKSAHRVRRSAILAPGIITPAATLPLAHSVAVAPAISPLSTIVAPGVAVGRLGLGHGLIL